MSSVAFRSLSLSEQSPIQQGSAPRASRCPSLGTVLKVALLATAAFVVGFFLKPAPTSTPANNPSPDPVKNPISVQVYCNDALRIREIIPISVLDNGGVRIPEIERTDSAGQFVIPGGGLYTPPFSLDRNIPGCERRPVQLGNNDDSGSVTLPFFPTTSDCSCSGLT